MKYHKLLGELTGGDLSHIFDELRKNDLIFRCDFSRIGKHFLTNFLSVNVFKSDFEAIRSEYVKLTEASNKRIRENLTHLFPDHEIIIPGDELEFYKYICKTYFDLVKEPKEELLQLYEQVTSDIRSIDETLSKIEAKLAEIQLKNDTGDLQSLKPVLLYYQKQNEKARADILSFLLHDIKDYALDNAYDHTLLSGLMGRGRYNYSWNSQSYKPRIPNDIENKFGKLAYGEVLRMIELHQTDRGAFDELLRSYIEEQDVIFSIRDLSGQHSVLAHRATIIDEALKVYEQGSKIMFANAVPTIIEGILHDICVLTGASENELLQHGFQYKLDHLLPHLSWELYYEYYAFRFRLFRNKVAHGRLTKSDVDEVADLLILDLYQVCTLVFSTKIKINQKRFLIDELYKNLTSPDFKLLLEYLLLRNEVIPEFFQLDEKIESVEMLIRSDEFWSYLETEMGYGEVWKHGIIHIVKIIKERKPFDKRCTALFKKAALTKPERNLVDEFIKSLTRGY